jgi:hypothetical protein
MLNPSLTFPPVCADGVVMFTAFDKIGVEYQEIALVTGSMIVDQGGGNATLYAAERKKAASLGANGLIVGSIREPTEMERIAAVFYGETRERLSSATAIYIPSDTLRVRVACAAKG